MLSKPAQQTTQPKPAVHQDDVWSDPLASGQTHTKAAGGKLYYYFFLCVKSALDPVKSLMGGSDTAWASCGWAATLPQVVVLLLGFCITSPQEILEALIKRGGKAGW